ncbi:MAG: hypothetical protein NZ922_03275 [Candidatus Methanomethyliaceae archaeon]|nr:hypothetical protein [Candidatus Methanomethyliaceae archaeon]MDW7970542.1 hypothetical protein [Nitrososphaerota archaeon]
MNGIKYTILIPLLLIPVVVTANQISIKIQSFTIYDISRDYINLEYKGSSEINIVVVRSDPNINVEIFKQINDVTSGYAKIYLTNTSRQSLTCIIGMFSYEPFSVSILARTTGVAVQQPQIISVPGNVSVQIEIPIIYGRYQQPVEMKSETNYSPNFPLWAIISYGIIIPMFLATAHLDKGSLKLLKKRWSQLDTFALILRYLFYAFLVIFFISTIAIIAEFIMIRIGMISTLHIGDWLLTCTIFSAIALVYGIGKWRGLFENLDEEE